MTAPDLPEKECPIKKVYERFKHMDNLLSDVEWLKGDVFDSSRIYIMQSFHSEGCVDLTKD